MNTAIISGVRAFDLKGNAVALQSAIGASAYACTFVCADAAFHTC